MLDITDHNSLSNLFAQLGLPSDKHSIEHFINTHKPLACAIPLAKAPWWNKAQAEFLELAINDDADWAIIVDKLNNLLRC